MAASYLLFSLAQASPPLKTCSTWRTRVARTAARTGARSPLKPEPHRGWLLLCCLVNAFPSSITYRVLVVKTILWTTLANLLSIYQQTFHMISTEKSVCIPRSCKCVVFVIVCVSRCSFTAEQDLPEGAAFSAGKVFPMSFPLKCMGCTSWHIPFDHFQPFRCA